MTQKASHPLSCEVVILTALPVEFQAVVAHLQELQEFVHPETGTIYQYGNFSGNQGMLHVAVAEIGMGGSTAAAETERAITFFRPQITMFVGIAGGLKDVKLGDVVAATKIYTYASGKAAQHFEPRPEVWRASYALEQRARAEARSSKWLMHLGDSCPTPTPQVYIGALAAGEQVLTSTQSDLFHLLKANYSDALAIEMEGHGFLTVVHANHTTYGLVIRGISDLIDDKAVINISGMQIEAARHAAAFAFQVLTTFTLPAFHSTSSPSASSAIWNVPYQRNPHFTGRDELLKRLEQQLSPEVQNHLVTTRQIALTQSQTIKGLGGIGKTQIAVEYAYRSRDLDRYTHTLWMNAASEKELITSFAELAELLPAFPAKGETNQHKLVEAIKRWLELCPQPWLLIFDNADDVALVRNYLPQEGNGSIVFTTRADAVGLLGAPSIEVESMGLREGTEFLLIRAQRQQASNEEQDEAANIVVALDFFPLALDQAGAYIEETKCGFVEYLKVYQAYRRALLARRGELATDYPYSVATTWSLSFQKIQHDNPAAAELLQLFAFLAPDRIPEELIKEGVAHWSPLLQQAVVDLFAFHQMIADLLKFSLVKRLTNDRIFAIHRLVQVVQRDLLAPETQRQWAESVVRAVNVVFPEDPHDIAKWPQCLRYLDQAQACDTLIAQYQFSLTEAADLLNRVGAYLDNHALYSIAEPLYRRALLIREQQLGTIHPDTANSLNNLALLYQHQGKYTEAEPLYRRALEIREQQMGTEHPDTASSLNNLAALYRAQGKYTEAEPFVRLALAIYERQMGTEHPDTASSLNNLAALYRAQGKYTEAEPLYRRALEIREQQLGSEHPDTASSLNNLALLYWNQGKYMEAEPLYWRALSIYEQQLGHDHPNTAQMFDNLATLYQLQDKYIEAEPLYRKALEIRERRSGAEHPDTALSLNNLATLYWKQGRYTEAEPLLKRALAIREMQLGDGHPDTAFSLNNLAALYQDQSRYIEAEPLFVRALEIREQRLGTEHPDLSQSLNNLAKLYQHQGKYTEAESLYLRALQICEQRLGHEHHLTQTIQNNYAILLRMVEREADAKQL